ncbi:hypothetical protein MUA77_05595 [Mammaliicoccus sciuri]|uniref:hypothetical protein n=1 Tax=Mammaliicoccus sciuri TaxID=1296 RepID=UPI0021D02A81|nr:hypothetical protein [Mammaliicoccus sciuri]UXU84863.1 hypothetical protein MUA77_05595 [Mammaliicoccus sciuri]UXU94710.1 hypothetical protein MUA42_05605 [Mammaliicoccus sciuri]UXV16659.1 hypothetical protein MUA89_05600 [Mammaliicoccus sciuri]UXV24919.1 hypothetical protein MUA49_05600 [Mammaliicoccus sciuri]UXV27705.1 hypothetical protein MUA96_05600 [Mammaliicoccus sciuri]
MKKHLITALGVSIILSGVSTSFMQNASAKENISSNVKTQESDEQIAYDENFILNELKGSQFAIALPIKEGTVKVPKGYTSSVVTNPETNQSFYKIKYTTQFYGLKKSAIVYSFRYGGKGLSTVLDVVSKDTAKYVRKNSGKIADAIDDAGAMIHGEIYQSLLSAGVPQTYARNIAWAIDAFLL